MLRVLAFLLIVFPLTAGAMELVMVEREGCEWCARWNAEIAPAYPKTEEGRRAPLRRADIHNLPADITFASPVIFTPTFVLVEDGAERGRLEGYMGSEFFWFRLSQILDRADQGAPKTE
ncbi:hypothetical protein [Pukyongiella litopenaei]|uniref:Regulatory protein n=1 Tax=Pukyongiella litopenaei TaxID=2605946 RepID=A0A2S0MMM4_9RHOB|nr:hypothetical protein [Pukyongiella litopenaei]AVO37135.1 hypothetical protein C6Y53_05070 [Pukyongiella litopenaei]